MSRKQLDYDADRMCPVYNEIIGSGLCYDTIMVMKKFVIIDFVPELSKVKDIEAARSRCLKCPYSDLS